MKVLISAYACEPDKGSEPGAGWNWSLAAARDNEVWVLTRANNREAIEAELSQRPQPNLRFVYVELPDWARWWKKGQRGVRLYYSVWQLAAYREARRLHDEIDFDLAHHITFANAWLPAGVAFVDAPFILGPVDAGLSVPVRFYGVLGPRGVLAEWKAEAVRTLARANPVTRRGIRRARLVIAQNDESARRLRSFGRPVIVRPHASVDRSRLTDEQAHPPAPRERTALVAGRLIALKGVVLAIRAIALLPDWRLEVVGSGPENRRLRKLVRALGVEARVTFIDWLPQRDLWRRMAESALVVVPSLRDAAPLVVAEAATLGVPVVALDQGGPRALADRDGNGIQLVPLVDPRQVTQGLANAIREVSLERTATASFDRNPLATELSAMYREITAAAARLRLWRHEAMTREAPRREVG